MEKILAVREGTSLLIGSFDVGHKGKFEALGVDLGGAVVLAKCNKRGFCW
jgi:hypothetical protein